MPSAVRKRSVEVNGHATSISIEDEFYQELARIAVRRGILIQTLVGNIARQKRQNNLSSEVRLTVLRELVRKAP